MARLKALDPELGFAGIGGPKMIAEGLESLFPMDELSVMGLTEVLPRLPSLLRRASETVEAIAASGAEALITIDSPDFCLRVAKRAKAANPSAADGALCRADGLGLAPGARGQDGRVHRPCPGALSV